MTTRAFVAALGAAVCLLATTNMVPPAQAQYSQFVSCPAPIAHCVSMVSGWCEKEPNGKITIVFYDKAYSWERYRQCKEAAATRGTQKATPKR